MTRNPPRPVTEQTLRAALILAFVAGIVRFFRLGHQSLWIDEVLMIQRASLGEPFRWTDWLANPQGPLPALLLRLSTTTFGMTEAAMRFPSALEGTLTVPLIFILSRKLNRASAWPAGLMAAFSPLLVWYSQETRHYALALLAAVWSAIALLKLLDEENPNGATLLSLSGSLLVGMMSHLSMVFVVAAQGLTLLIWHRGRFKAWLLAAVPVFLLMSPWFVVAVTENLNLKHLVHAGPIPAVEMLRGESTFSWWGIPYTAYVFFAGYSLGPPLGVLHAHPSPASLLPYAPAILALAASVGTLVIAGIFVLRKSPSRLGLVFLWTALPLLAVILLSLRNAKVFNPRYVIVALPLWLCVAGAGWNALFRKSRALGLALALLLAGSTIVSLFQYSFDGRYAREDVRSAAARLTLEALPGDIVLAQGVPQVLDWYYHGLAPVQTVHEFDVRTEDRLDAKLSEWLVGHRRAWLFISRPWLQDPQLRLKGSMDRLAGPGTEEEFDGVRLILYDLGESP